jgi:O-antigen/teichoic acid export membrane protein
MNVLLRKYITNKSGLLYISSGLFKTIIHTLSGFIILRWIRPEELGVWQSFTVFAIYLNIFTLGVPTGLNRELPFWLGKKEHDKAINILKSAGSYISRISMYILILTTLVCLILYSTNIVSSTSSLMLFSAFSIAIVKIRANFLGVTYRSNQSFKQLGRIQFIMAFIQLILIPIVYFLGIWGYILYQLIVVITLYTGFYIKRPYKVKYEFNKTLLLSLIKVGLPMFIWNFLVTSSKSIPRLTLVFFGAPYLVGLFSPAESLNKAVQQLPNYINLFLFPKISFKFGQTNDKTVVTKKVFIAATYIFFIMLLITIVIISLTPILFETLFPKYIKATLAVQVILFSCAFFSVSQLLHNTINSFKEFYLFRYLVPMRFIFTIASIFVTHLIIDDLILSVAFGTTITEILVMVSYIYMVKYRTT